MKTMKVIVLSIVFLFFLGSIALASSTEKEELASFITAHIPGSPDNGKKIIDFIKEKLGVEVRADFISCGEVGAKLNAEAPYFTADMNIAQCSPQTYEAKKKGWLVSYKSPAWDPYKRFFDPDNYFVELGNYVFVMVANKKRLAKKGYTAPKTWKDLLDPKWKDEIVMPSPLSSGTAFTMVYSFMALYGFNEGKGEQGGWEYLEALDKNIHHYTRSGAAPGELVSRGEFSLGITSDENIMAYKKEGYPIEVIIPEEGIGFNSVYAFILKGTKKLYTCQKIIDLLATSEFDEIFAPGGYATKTIPDPVIGLNPNYIDNIDLGWAFKNKDRLNDEWKSRFLTK